MTQASAPVSSARLMQACASGMAWSTCPRADRSIDSAIWASSWAMRSALSASSRALRDATSALSNSPRFA